jgi:hypothetical protein
MEIILSVSKQGGNIRSVALRHDDEHGLGGQTGKKAEPEDNLGQATEITTFLKRLSNYVRILNALDVTASHGMLHIVYKLFPISP